MTRLPASLVMLVALVVTAAMAGCSSSGKKGLDDTVFVDRPPENIYNTAMDELEIGNYNQAVVEFAEVERQHPYSQWATKSKLMAAYTYYIQAKYDDAIEQLDRFIALHPGNKDAPYAFYLKALSYYEQITDVERDQRVTERALASLEEVAKRFPDTPYGKDAKGKIVLTKDHLAGKEIEIGRYYQKSGNYLAAINRYKTVLVKHDGTAHVPEALHRLTECYLSLGMTEEARRTAAVLGYNFPDSSWYRDSYALLQSGKASRPVETAAPEDRPGLFSRTWNSIF